MTSPILLKTFVMPKTKPSCCDPFECHLRKVFKGIRNGANCLSSSVETFLKGKFLKMFQPLLKICLSSLPRKAVMFTQKMI